MLRVAAKTALVTLNKRLKSVLSSLLLGAIRIVKPRHGIRCHYKALYAFANSSRVPASPSAAQSS